MNSLGLDSNDSYYCNKLSQPYLLHRVILQLYFSGSGATAPSQVNPWRQNPSDLCCQPSLRPPAAEVERNTAFSQRKVTLTALVMSLFCSLICDWCGRASPCDASKAGGRSLLSPVRRGDPGRRWLVPTEPALPLWMPHIAFLYVEWRSNTTQRAAERLLSLHLPLTRRKSSKNLADETGICFCATCLLYQSVSQQIRRIDLQPFLELVHPSVSIRNIGSCLLLRIITTAL